MCIVPHCIWGINLPMKALILCPGHLFMSLSARSSQARCVQILEQWIPGPGHYFPTQWVNQLFLPTVYCPGTCPEGLGSLASWGSLITGALVIEIKSSIHLFFVWTCPPEDLVPKHKLRCKISNLIREAWLWLISRWWQNHMHFVAYCSP